MGQMCVLYISINICFAGLRTLVKVFVIYYGLIENLLITVYYLTIIMF